MTSDNYPKVLIICPVPFSDVGSAKTISALFRSYQKECLAQFYTYDVLPGSYETCENFFRITEMDVYKANLKFTVAEGSVFTKSKIVTKEATKEVSISAKSWWGIRCLKHAVSWILYNRSGFGELLRDLLWRKSKWLSPNFIDWLDEFRPQAVFYYNNWQSYYHRITHYICHRYKIPLSIYATDDYTYCKNVYSPFAWLNHIRWMSHFKKNLSMASKFYASNPGMLEEYKNKFAIDNIGLIFNCVPIRDDVDIEDFTQMPLRLIYAGSLYLNRHKVLAFLANCLLDLHRQGYNVILDIYTVAPPSERILKELNKTPVSYYKGALNQSELLDEISKSNVPVHVESFIKRDIKSARLSISTKISDYMVGNRMILAIGPKEVESIRYLKGSGAALCINTMDKDEVVAMLKNSLFDADYRRQLAEKGRIVVSENHDMLKNQSILYKDLCELTT